MPSGVMDGKYVRYFEYMKQHLHDVNPTAPVYVRFFCGFDLAQMDRQRQLMVYVQSHPTPDLVLDELIALSRDQFERSGKVLNTPCFTDN